jgi:uncharacterized protein
MLEVDTPHGRAKVHLHPVDEPRAALVLGHGAAGGVESRDLVAATEAALSERVTVALVEQPYRVAGRRSPAPAGQLDVAWTTVVDYLREGELSGLSLVVGGRSLGARVACRTVESTGAIAVLCLAFPLQPPRRRSAAAPDPSRLQELDDVPSSRRKVVQVPGNHSLRTDLDAVASAVREWLPSVLGVRVDV